MVCEEGWPPNPRARRLPVAIPLYCGDSLKVRSTASHPKGRVGHRVSSHGYGNNLLIIGRARSEARSSSIFSAWRVLGVCRVKSTD
jgi:hypothetical protein